jgi:UDP-N-acetylmuramyl pentapeptide phosphotransferase/UDP-N-acetylglucosamine-1-phosphate transferase
VTTLPAHRRVINGRTHDRSWSPAEMDPIEHYQSPRGMSERVFVILVVVIGLIGLAVSV